MNLNKSKSMPFVAGKAFTKYRDYIKENDYLNGLIKITTLVKTDTLENEVIVQVPKGIKVTIKVLE